MARVEFAHMRSFDRRGYTLAELVLVAAIMATLVMIAMPRYANAVARARVTSAARRVAADLNFARTQAMSHSKSVPVVFNTAARSYTMTGIPDLKKPSVDYTVLLGLNNYGLSALTTSFASNTATYDMYGRPSAGGSVTVAIKSYSATVTLDPNSGKAVAP